MNTKETVNGFEPAERGSNVHASERALSNLDAISSGASFVETYRRELERRKREKEERERRLQEDWGYFRLFCKICGDDYSMDNSSLDDLSGEDNGRDDRTGAAGAGAGLGCRRVQFCLWHRCSINAARNTALTRQVPPFSIPTS
ncbi:MAG: hypothetical protein J6T04_03425 [Bacteroidales bacterium]|nr:hypothetical protein [Bacteroidales bacterium]